MQTQEIDNAIAAHRSWKMRLKQIVDTGVLDTPLTTIRSRNECNFGKWVHGNTLSPEEKNSQHYKTVVDLHTKFHEIAAKIAQLATTGKKDEAAKLLEIGGEFLQISSKLTAALTSWKGSHSATPVR